MIHSCGFFNELTDLDLLNVIGQALPARRERLFPTTITLSLVRTALERRTGFRHITVTLGLNRLVGKAPTVNNEHWPGGPACLLLHPSMDAAFRLCPTCHRAS